MLNIAIIDDEEIMLNEISQLIRSVESLPDEIHMDCFSSAEEFLNYESENDLNPFMVIKRLMEVIL